MGAKEESNLGKLFPSKAQSLETKEVQSGCTKMAVSPVP
jgi:hypothetical protein